MSPIDVFAPLDPSLGTMESETELPLAVNGALQAGHELSASGRDEFRDYPLGKLRKTIEDLCNSSLQIELLALATGVRLWQA
jgi:hypothetical protein